MKKYICDICATIQNSVEISAENIGEVTQKALALSLAEAQKPGSDALGSVVSCIRDEENDEYDPFDMSDIFVCDPDDDDDLPDEDFMTGVLLATIDVARERKDLSAEEIAKGILKAAKTSMDDE